MTATLIFSEGVQEIADRPKVYDIEISHLGEIYWKIGLTSKSLRKRFAAEPSSTVITVRQLWHFASIERAEAREASLLRKFKCQSPYIGKMGPLVGGGNTEVFSHDGINGHAAPIQFKVVLIDEDGYKTAFSTFWDFDPWSRWSTRYSWVDGLIEPPFHAHLIIDKSTQDKIVVCSTDLLEQIVEERRGRAGISWAYAQEILDYNAVVTTYEIGRSFVLNVPYHVGR